MTEPTEHLTPECAAAWTTLRQRMRPLVGQTTQLEHQRKMLQVRIDGMEKIAKATQENAVALKTKLAATQTAYVKAMRDKKNALFERYDDGTNLERKEHLKEGHYYQKA